MLLKNITWTTLYNTSYNVNCNIFCILIYSDVANCNLLKYIFNIVLTFNLHIIFYFYQYITLLSLKHWQFHSLRYNFISLFLIILGGFWYVKKICNKSTTHTLKTSNNENLCGNFWWRAQYSFNKSIITVALMHTNPSKGTSTAFDIGSSFIYIPRNRNHWSILTISLRSTCMSIHLIRKLLPYSHTTYTR